ncbi:YciI family protein [Phytoactinopolyspora endophytica]|uniref:YciI family protein n=1 Tax=Phytoactinopolyspora endophytica TaxID=1642495 RepID=UPI00101D9E43|nr:YciI family protein [Phytoactinopolyspora endophytica]
MKYMLLMTYGLPRDVDEKHGEMSTWPPEDIKAHIEFQHAINKELIDNGELVDGQGLAGPDQAKIVRFDGHSTPVTTDGPFPESKEFLAGYRIVDVETEERALEIAAKMSAGPGRGGEALNIPIEVRQVMSAPDVDV